MTPQEKLLVIERNKSLLFDDGVKLLPYVPKSNGFSLEVMIAKNMAFEILNALDDLEKRNGNIDTYLQKKLGYPDIETLYKALAAEQIDGVALAIDAIEEGSAIIIADQTGMGKGRQVASIVRYSILNGKTPIFITEKSNLFSDLYRDLKDIGSDDLLPLIINSDDSAKITIYNEENESTKLVCLTKDNVKYCMKPLGNAALKDLVEGTTENPIPYDYVMATYSQFSSDFPSQLAIKKGKKRPTKAGEGQFKCDFIRRIADENAILILDEAHNSAGRDSTTGYFIGSILQNVYGCTYLSATFAKTPYSMPIYAIKTAIKDAQIENDKLVEVVLKGGIVLQEILTSQLAETGQLIRRERPYDGIKISYETIGNKEEMFYQFDKATEIINDIISFQEVFVSSAIESKEEDLKNEGVIVKEAKGVQQGGINNAPFVSRLFNLIDQLLLAIKAVDVAMEAVNQLKLNKKPIIAIRSTMESFFNDMDLKQGDEVSDLSFKNVFYKCLESVRKIQVTDFTGEKVAAIIEIDELSKEGQEFYYNILKKVDDLVLGINASPLDVMRSIIQSYGYTVGEVTGRSMQINFTNDEFTEGIVSKYKVNKNEVFSGFNNWKENSNDRIDAIILNKSGATGASLHSSAKFIDQRQRIMVVCQVELDVNVEVQKRGRVNRTGQVNKPEYLYLMSHIPAEERLFLMLKNKLKSLDASTTGSQKTSNVILEATDFNNKYGDEIVKQYLLENYDLVSTMRIELQRPNEETKEDKYEDISYDFMKRLCLLPTKIQEKALKEVTERYSQYIKFLIDNDQYDLEVSLLNLRAETLEKSLAISGSGTPSVFGQSAYLETCIVNILRKPMKLAEIKATTSANFKWKSIREYKDYYFALIDRYDLVKETTIQGRFNKLRAEIEDKILKVKAIVVEDEKDAEKKNTKLLGLEAQLTEAISNYERNIDTIKSFSSGVKTLFGFFYSNKVVKVPYVDDNDAYAFGIILSVKFTDENKEPTPLIASNIVVEVAIADSRRKLSLGLSQARPFIDAMFVKSQFISANEIENVNTNWDKNISSSTRETASIITGNILKGLEYSNGKLIKFTDIFNNIRTGILVAKKKKEDEDDSAIEKGMSIVDIKTAIDTVLEGKSIISSNDELSIGRYNTSLFRVNFNKSSVVQLYKDEKILSYMYDSYGNNVKTMYQSNDRQSMFNFIKSIDVKDFITYLSDKFKIKIKQKTEIITVQDSFESDYKNLLNQFKVSLNLL